MTPYTTQMRKQIADHAQGQTVVKLEYVESGDYWVMTLNDGTEFSFRFMVELEHKP